MGRCIGRFTAVCSWTAADTAATCKSVVFLKCCFFSFFGIWDFKASEFRLNTHTCFLMETWSWTDNDSDQLSEWHWYQYINKILSVSIPLTGIKSDKSFPAPMYNHWPCFGFWCVSVCVCMSDTFHIDPYLNVKIFLGPQKKKKKKKDHFLKTSPSTLKDCNLWISYRDIEQN